MPRIILNKVTTIRVNLFPRIKMQKTINDPHFQVETISASFNPEQVVYAAMHQDYFEDLVYNEIDLWPSRKKSAELIIKNLLQGGRGHWGPFEHPQLVLNCGYFPHGCMQQLRTHRNISFDVQSGRYTGQRILDVVEGARSLESVFYLRPVGSYSNRQGKKYDYSHEQREEDLDWCLQGCRLYQKRIEQGLSEEHARGIIPFDFRQHWVVSGNARAMLHLFDVRSKKDVQPEAITCIEMMFEQFKKWMPEVGRWYEDNRWSKGRLAP